MHAQRRKAARIGIAPGSSHYTRVMPGASPLASAIITVTVAIVAIIALAVVPFVSARAIIPSIAMTLLVTWNIFVLVPAILHEVDPLAAGVVGAAVFAPVFRMAWRHMQVDRRTANANPFDKDRLPIDNLRGRIAADVETAIEAGLADADRYAHIGGECRDGGNGKDCGKK